MGVRGPVPKREAERLGHRAKEDKPTTAPSGTHKRVPMPRPPQMEEWHEIARWWYESLDHSGQNVFYEPSDWMTAVMVAEQMSRELNEKYLGMGETGPHYGEAPISGQSMNAMLKAMSSLLVTEGDRRRAALELNRKVNEEEEDAKILSLVRDDEEAAFG